MYTCVCVFWVLSQAAAKKAEAQRLLDEAERQEKARVLAEKEVERKEKDRIRKLAEEKKRQEQVEYLSIYI